MEPGDEQPRKRLKTEGTPDVDRGDAPTAGAGPEPAGAPAGNSAPADNVEPEAKPPAAVTAAPVGAYTAREEFLIKLEQAGDIGFHYVVNDGAPQNMIWLIGLKNIYSKQLPNMPKEYICRLVLDRRHRSVALVKRNGDVIGGITYRIFPEQGLGEIAFCAVASTEQVKGYGTRLMNYTKQYARDHDGTTHFLTYADNNAVGYFCKQGFTKEITMPKDRWVGYIKDYDGGTLMEFVLHPKLPYVGFPGMIKAQRGALEGVMRTLSSSHVVHPGLKHFKAPGAAPLPIGDIPGVCDAGWRPEAVAPPPYRLVLNSRQVPATRDNLQQFMEQLVADVRRHPDSWPFREPVSVAEAPDYYDIIKNPVDLTTVEARLGQQRYVTLELLAADLRVMFSNCRVYNAPDTVYYKLAARMEHYVDDQLAANTVFE